MYKKHKRLLLILLTLSAIILSFYGYQQFKAEKPKVVVVVRDSKLQYWEIIKAGAEKGFKDFGADGKVVAPKNGIAEEQSDLLENVLKEHPDVLIVSPVNADIIPVLDKFSKADIPVIIINKDELWKDKVSYIGSDNLELGGKAGIWMASQLQPGDKVALLGRGVSYDVDRLKGAKTSLEAAGINIVVEKGDLEIDNPKDVEKAMETILQEHPDLKGVVTASDYVAIPAFHVIQKQGFEIPVTGVDGLTEMLELIEKGTLSGTVAQNPYDMGYLSVEAALKVTKGQKVNRNIDTGVDIITSNNVKQRLDFTNNVLGRK